MLIYGNKLPYHLQEEAKRRYIYRWTRDNPQRESSWAFSKGRPTLPLISDAEWLARTEFHVKKDLSGFDNRCRFCVTH